MRTRKTSPLILAAMVAGSYSLNYPDIYTRGLYKEPDDTKENSPEHIALLEKQQAKIARRFARYGKNMKQI